MTIVRKNIQEFAGAAGNNTYIYWGRWGSNATLSAFVAGTTGTVGAGTSAGMGRWVSMGAITWTIPELPSIAVPNEGGSTDIVRGQATDAPTGELTYGVMDLDVPAAATNALIQTVGAHDVVADSMVCKTFYPLHLVINVPGYSRDSTKPGTVWVVHEFLYTQMDIIADNNITQGNALENSARLTFNHTTILPWGTAITSALTGFNQAWRIMPYVSENPIYYHTYVGNNAVGTCTLDTAPVSNDGDALMAWKNGVLMTYGAGAGNYTTVGTTVTFGTTPAALETWVFRVQHSPTC